MSCQRRDFRSMVFLYLQRFLQGFVRQNIAILFLSYLSSMLFNTLQRSTPVTTLFLLDPPNHPLSAFNLPTTCKLTPLPGEDDTATLSLRCKALKKWALFALGRWTFPWHLELISIPIGRQYKGKTKPFRSGCPLKNQPWSRKRTTLDAPKPTSSLRWTPVGFRGIWSKCNADTRVAKN